MAGGRTAPTRHHVLVRTETAAALCVVGLLLLSWSAYLIGSGSDQPSSSIGASLAGTPVQEAHPPPPASPSPSDRRTDDTAPRAGTGLRRVPTVAYARTASSVASPVSLAIPALDLQQQVVPLDVVDGALQVPQRWRDVGWWEDGPNPGAAGSAVLVGHVDSRNGPAVFYGLSALRPGDVVSVRHLDRTTEKFRVARVSLVDRNDFPSERIYRQKGPPTLRLITCGGTYDQDADRYNENVVVTAYPMMKAANEPR